MQGSGSRINFKTFELVGHCNAREKAGLCDM